MRDSDYSEDGDYLVDSPEIAEKRVKSWAAGFLCCLIESDSELRKKITDEFMQNEEDAEDREDFERLMREWLSEKMPHRGDLLDSYEWMRISEFIGG